MEAALAPTLNGVTPYGGIRNAEWIFQDLHHFAGTKAMQQLASEVITAPRVKFSAPQLVHILVESRPILHCRTFEWLFAKVSQHCRVRTMSSSPEEYISRCQHTRLPSSQKPENGPCGTSRLWIYPPLSTGGLLRH